ncbi:MAG: phosphoketolase family protein [Puniceicoccales bacterium]
MQDETTTPPTPSLSPFGPARASIPFEPLPDEERLSLQRFWSASCYLAAGMIYLRENPLLQEPLRPEHLKRRLLGHWGSSPGQAFIWTHLNRVVKRDLTEVLYISGPGHGAPGVLGPNYLEGSYTRFFPEVGQNVEGMLRLFRSFSFPGGIGSHCTPETPGSIHEGGELGYSLSHGFGAAFDNPDLIAAVVVGDGEAETGPLAASWHSNKFLNPARDGAVLPILHLNGYKINNPTLFARMPRCELEWLFKGYGYEPFFVEGSDPDSMHDAMAATLDRCFERIREIQEDARKPGAAITRPTWPMIVLRSPKGWTGPKTIDGHQVEGFWRSHQVPLSKPTQDGDHLQLLENWLRSYEPEKLFDKDGQPCEEIRRLSPPKELRIGSSPYANGKRGGGGLSLPNFREYGQRFTSPGREEAGNTTPLGEFLRDVLRANPSTFRVFGPDETTSNKLDATYQAGGKTWLSEKLAVDDDGGDLEPFGRVMEILSEHTLEGWMEGYTLTGRSGLLSTYESFAHVIDSMVNQHAKWLEMAASVPWRRPVPGLNLLITSTVWRQDHNGFTHQDPGFLDIVMNKRAEHVRVYFPPDANCLLSTADFCLRSKDRVNVIVSDKQQHLQYLAMDEAIRHCEKGIGIWDWASNDQGTAPDVVLASAGDIPTREALAAIELLRDEFPELRIRFINVVDIFRLQSPKHHPHGLSDTEFDSLFTTNKPIIFNFHGYPNLVHRLTYSRKGQANLHVCGYCEKGNINTPMELAINNGIDRFSLAIDVIDRVPKLREIGGQSRERFVNQRLDCRDYAYREGQDDPAVVGWRWGDQS